MAPGYSTRTLRGMVFPLPTTIERVIALVLTLFLFSFLKEKLRLRGIDCPELNIPKGKAAKRFVERLASQAKSVTITTTKPDK